MARTKLRTDSEGYVRVDRDYVVSIKASEPPQPPAPEGESEEESAQPQPQPKVTYNENPETEQQKHRVSFGIFTALWVVLILSILINCTLAMAQFLNNGETASVADVPGLLEFVTFMQSGLGLIIFVVLPAVLLIVHYVVQRKKENKTKNL